MLRSLVWLWLVVLCIASGVGAAHAITQTMVLNLKIEPGQAQTRLTMQLSSKTLGRIFAHDNQTIIIQLAHTGMNFTLSNVNLAGSNINTISAKRDKKGNLRFILKVKEPLKWKINFTPLANGQSELVVTLLSEKSQAPSAQAADPFQVAVTKDLASLPEHEVIGKARLEAEHNKQRLVGSKITIVIDPGHGGKDPGAKGSGGGEEKQVVLAIAKRLAALINATPNMQAVLTRSNDRYIPLRERIQFARKGDADLFIAVHADAYFNKTASGVSVFALSQHGATNEAARWLAKKDKYPELSDVALNNLKDRSLLLRSVLIDMAQTATIRDSLRLGNAVLDAMDNVSNLHATHVEQAPFVVLKSPDIPSILIETGFISNPAEERRLINPHYQEQLSISIYKGILKYLKANQVM